MTQLTSLLTRFKSTTLAIMAFSTLFISGQIMATPIEVKLTTSAHSLQQLQLTYPAPPRLEQLLTDSIANINQLPLSQKNKNNSKNQTELYWSGAALVLNPIHPQKELITKRVKQLATFWQGKDKQAILTLYNLLQNEEIGERAFIPIDYDLVRINLKHNPLIANNATLVLPPRPRTIRVMGAVTKPQQFNWHERWSANRYLEQANPLESAMNSEAWVIQPDGKVEKHPIAYWNQKHMDIAPGATIYLGFSSLPKGFEALNEKIVNLLRNQTL